jgi:hypothetical protein
MEVQFEKFKEHCEKYSVNRKLILSDVSSIF